MRSLKLVLAAVLFASCGKTNSEFPPLEGVAAWPQWGQNPQHTGRVPAVGQSPDRVLAQIVYDPFVAQEQATSGGPLYVHYPTPLLVGDDVFLSTKSGSYTGVATWDTQIWNVQRLRWQDGSLEPLWSFASDWKPEPDAGRLFWEPVFQPALAGERLYVPGMGGTVHLLDAASGDAAARINPFGTSVDASIYVAGPLSADAAGNIYYNALRLDRAGPWTRNVLGAWLVRLTPDGQARVVSFEALTAGAPGADELCLTTFVGTPLPWPPTPAAVTSSEPCGSQRPGLNVAPAIAPDGTIYTVSRAHLNSRYSYVVAVNSDLTPRWSTSLRGRFQDGCGVPLAAGGTLPPNGAPGGCRSGSRLGVDPLTNLPGDGEVLDQSTASPVVAPDGGVFYGAWTRYNTARGHLMKFAPDGRYLGEYGFGWDITPAVAPRGDGYALILKDNTYAGVGSYCNDPRHCPGSEHGGPFRVVSVRGDSLTTEWAFVNTETRSCRRNADGSLACVDDHPGSFEWCINAPAVDANGFVYGNSEDGNLYILNPDGSLRQRVFLQLALEAAYTPVALDGAGRIHAQNAGRLFVLGR